MPGSALISSMTLVKSLNLLGLRKGSILALDTTYENRHKPYKIRTVKAFWLLSKFMARKKKYLLRLQASPRQSQDQNPEPLALSPMLSPHTPLPSLLPQG